jgi:hypothetical protein
VFAFSALASTVAAVVAAQLSMRKPSPADLREL